MLCMCVCGWRAGMYGWNAGGEPSDRFGLRLGGRGMGTCRL